MDIFLLSFFSFVLKMLLVIVTEPLSPNTKPMDQMVDAISLASISRAAKQYSVWTKVILFVGGQTNYFSLLLHKELRCVLRTAILLKSNAIGSDQTSFKFKRTNS